MNILTKIHYLNDANECIECTPIKDYVSIVYYSSIEDYNNKASSHEYLLPYKLLDEILRVRKPT